MHKILSAILLTCSIATSAACGGEPDIASETCQRLDECNVLGTSVNDCTEEFDLLLADLTPSDRNDFERLMDGCLDFDGCSTFLDCAGLSDLDDGGSTGGGGGGSPAPETPTP